MRTWVGPVLLAVAACSPPASDADDAGASADATPDATEAPDGGAAADDATVPCLFCTDATEDLPDWVRVQAEIDRVCSFADNCHGSNAGGLGLSPGHEFDPIIDVPSVEMPTLMRVKPGDPANSYVYRKLACEGGITGDCMPNYAAFDPTLPRIFHDWIEAGAPTQ